MKRILVIGCPGSGKSTFAKQLKVKLNYPLLHIDRIFHIDNWHSIDQGLLKKKIINFVNENDCFIIDGNYTGTLKLRMNYADTIFYFQINNRTCLSNIINRCNDLKPRDDIAPGFDNSILDPAFVEYVKNFPFEQTPIIDDMLESFDGKIIRFKNYLETENFINNIKQFDLF